MWSSAWIMLGMRLQGKVGGGEGSVGLADMMDFYSAVWGKVVVPGQAFLRQYALPVDGSAYSFPKGRKNFCYSGC